MTGRKLLVAVVSVLALSSIPRVARAAPPFHGTSPDALEGYCNENGGTYFPPSAGGVYACLLGDGTLIACGGLIPICTQSSTVPAKSLSASDFLTIETEASILTKLNDISTQLTNLQSLCSGTLQ